MKYGIMSFAMFAALSFQANGAMVRTATEIFVTSHVDGVARALQREIDESRQYTEGLEYIFNTNMTASVISENWPDDVMIPQYAYSNGVRYAVTSIQMGDGSGVDNVSKVCAPFIDTLGEGSFFFFTNLSSVSLPCVMNIEYGAFEGCRSLRYFESVYATNIGQNAFYGCDSLFGVYLPNVISISQISFDDCISLVDINLQSAKYIGSSSFANCSSINTISLPKAEILFSYAFENCTSLTTVYLPYLTLMDHHAFAGCTSLSEIHLDSVQEIRGDAFIGCTNLNVIDFGSESRYVAPSDPGISGVIRADAKIVVPDSQYDEFLEKWHIAVSNGYRFIKHSDWEPARKYEIDDINMRNRLLEWYPNGSVTNKSQISGDLIMSGDPAIVAPFCAYDSIPHNTKAGLVVIPPYYMDDVTVVKIGGSSETDDSNPSTTAIIAPTTIMDIESRAFYRCEALESVYFPSVTNIGIGAFYLCYRLKSVFIPEAVEIGSFAFAGCAIESLNLPVSRNVGDNAFNGNEYISSVYIPSVEYIGSAAFRGCRSLKSISLPSVKMLGEEVFDQCINLGLIDFGSVGRSDLRSINANAFYGLTTNCVIILPDDDYIHCTNSWNSLVSEGYRLVRHSESDYVRRYELGDLATISSVSNVAVCATNYTDVVSSNVAVCATNYTDVVSSNVAVCATNYTYSVSSNVAVCATNYTYSVSSNVAVCATNYTYSVSSNVAVCATNYTDCVSSNVAVCATNYTDKVVSDADTSYLRVYGNTTTNLNQSVQYLIITDEVPSTLTIELPEDGRTKDWIVYVTSVTNVALSLKPATYWVADDSYTNDIAPRTPTALYFTEATNGVFVIGRQEMKPITITE